ncbi:MAG: FlgD immunoglobulin-like domain containing protein, partial [bacterium]
FYLKEQNQPNSLGSQLADLVKSPLSKEAIDQLFDPTVPVELASFTATVEKNNVHLIWLTATETNNYGFEIERRFQDSNEWTKIAFVPGNGTTTNPVHYDYFDRNLQPGTYEYRLKQIDSDGSFEYHGAVTAVVGIPQTFVLHQNFPNPFNPSTEIQYQLPSRAGEFVGKVRTFLKIYNLLGQEVRTLVDEEKAPGYYKVIWDGKDNIGRGVTSGVYIYRLQSGDLVDIKKMVFVQ